jgi:hypothetical protein
MDLVERVAQAQFRLGIMQSALQGTELWRASYAGRIVPVWSEIDGTEVALIMRFEDGGFGDRVLVYNEDDLVRVIECEPRDREPFMLTWTLRHAEAVAA